MFDISSSFAISSSAQLIFVKGQALVNFKAITIRENSEVVLTKNSLKKVRIENKKGGLLSLVGHGLDF